METITEMKAAPEMALPGRHEADGAYVDIVSVDMAKVAGLSTGDLLDRLSALEQADAVLAELQTAVLDEMTRRWGRTQAVRIWQDCLRNQ